MIIIFPLGRTYPNSVPPWTHSNTTVNKIFSMHWTMRNNFDACGISRFSDFTRPVFHLKGFLIWQTDVYWIKNQGHRGAYKIGCILYLTLELNRLSIHMNEIIIEARSERRERRPFLRWNRMYTLTKNNIVASFFGRFLVPNYGATSVYYEVYDQVFA